jgi:hypothetical protein
MFKSALGLRKPHIPITFGFACVSALIVLSACEGSKAPKMPSIEEIKKQAPIPKEVDVKSYTEGNVVRNEAGSYVIPWRELTTCDGPNSCKSDVINEVTKEVAIKEGVIQAPWRETGKGSEIARPAKEKPDEKAKATSNTPPIPATQK